MSLSNQEIEMDDFDFDDGGEDDNAFVVLMVAEKPSIAALVAGVLSDGTAIDARSSRTALPLW